MPALIATLVLMLISVLLHPRRASSGVAAAFVCLALAPAARTLLGQARHETWLVVVHGGLLVILSLWFIKAAVPLVRGGGICVLGVIT